MARLTPIQLFEPLEWVHAEQDWLAWDRSLSNSARNFCDNSDYCVPILNFLTESLSAKILFIYLACASLWWATNSKKPQIRLIYFAICGAVIGLSDLFCNQLKYAFMRLRPHHSIDLIREGVKISYSFPSAHAFNMGAVLGILYAFISVGFVKLKKTLLFFIIVGIVISFARLFEGKHFFTDILTGYFIGFLFSTTLCRILLKRVN